MSRVTNLSTIGSFLRHLDAVANRVQSGQIKLTTGLNYQRLSDNPFAINQILGFRSEGVRLTQLQRNVDDGQSQLTFLDGKLQSLTEGIRDGRTLGLQGLNGSLARADRAAIAQSLDQSLRAFIDLGNTQLSGRSLFGGARTLDLPFITATDGESSQISDVRYTGNQQSIARRIGVDTRYGINFTGDELLLEQTYARLGKTFPTEAALGFDGTLQVNGTAIEVQSTDSLKDLVRRINLTDGLEVSARIRNSKLELYSDWAVKGFTITDDQNGDLLTDLGINLRGAYTTGFNPVATGSLPLIDSTPAIFTAAGNVASLEITGDNNILNLHLGANANEGTSVSHVVRIPEGTYATVADLATAIQGAVDDQFGRNKIVVNAVGGALELRTSHNGAPIGTADLQVGGQVDGVDDTAADAATLNLVAGPGPAALTNATVAGTDGTDRFSIDLGSLVTPSGLEQPAIEIDLAAANTGSASALVSEINTQIRNDVRLRGAVEARLQDGQIVFETTTRGGKITPSQLAVSDLAPGTLAILGDFTNRPASLTGGVPLVPAVITEATRFLTIDVGPSVSGGGLDLPPLTIALATGTYLTSQAYAAALNEALRQQPELTGQLVFTTTGPLPTDPIVLSTVGSGSQYRAEDITVSGPLDALLALGSGIATDGSGTAPGEGVELEARNTIKDFIALRDDLLDVADPRAIAKELQTADGTGLGLFDGDDITVKHDGQTIVFQHRAGETLGSLVAEFNRIFGGGVEFTVTRDGRISADNKQLGAVTDFSITASSPHGDARTVFNTVLGELNPTLPAGGTATSGAMVDPRRRERGSTEELGKIDRDMENALRIQAVIGARSNRLSQYTTVISDATLSVLALKTGIEGVNIPQVLTQLSADQAALEAALNVGSRILPSSLFQFLR
ncbi:MAG: hypothetical protein ABI743_01915 [bacterium]